MAVREKTVYVASDGKEFNSRQAAENHDHDILYQAYRGKEKLVSEFLESCGSHVGLQEVWDHRELLKEYFEARANYERY